VETKDSRTEANVEDEWHYGTKQNAATRRRGMSNVPWGFFGNNKAKSLSSVMCTVVRGLWLPVGAGVGDESSASSTDGEGLRLKLA
jgi:hypothetical protein